MVFNGVIPRLLRSRWHALAGRHTVLLEIRGRRSGRVFEVPVTALPDGDALRVRSRAERVWWRNLRGGAPVGVWVGGRHRTAHADVDESGAYPVVSLRLE